MNGKVVAGKMPNMSPVFISCFSIRKCHIFEPSCQFWWCNANWCAIKTTKKTLKKYTEKVEIGTYKLLWKKTSNFFVNIFHAFRGRYPGAFFTPCKAARWINFILFLNFDGLSYFKLLFLSW